MSGTLEYDFRTIINESTKWEALASWYANLASSGFDKMRRIPTYQALDIYKNSLWWEDFDNKFMCSNRSCLFSEAGEIKRYFSPDINLEKWSVFSKLLTSGRVSMEELALVAHKRQVKNAIKAKFVFEDSDLLQCRIRCVPTDFASGFILSDPVFFGKENHVHIGLDSILFMNFLEKHKKKWIKCRSILDLGCGSCLHGLYCLSRTLHSHLMAVDCNERAISCSLCNGTMNGLVDRMVLSLGNWFDAVPSEKKFDLILCNPPFEWRSRQDEAVDKICATGGKMFGHEQTLYVLNEIDKHLDTNGTAFILTQTLIDLNGNLLLHELALSIMHKISKCFCITTYLLYEHLLVSEESMRVIINQGFSHFVIILLEISGCEQHRSQIQIKDDRTFLKRISDKCRIRRCNRWWKRYLAVSSGQ